MSGMNDTTFLPSISSLPPSRHELGFLYTLNFKSGHVSYSVQSQVSRDEKHYFWVDTLVSSYIILSLAPAEVVVKLQFEMQVQTELSHAGQLSWRC